MDGGNGALVRRASGEFWIAGRLALRGGVLPGEDAKIENSQDLLRVYRRQSLIANRPVQYGARRCRPNRATQTDCSI